MRWWTLTRSDFDRRWLAAADRLAGRMVADFWNFTTPRRVRSTSRPAHSDLLVRTKPFYDGPVPSGNATAAMVLLRLSKLLELIGDYFSKAERSVGLAGRSTCADRPRAHLRLLCAADFYLSPTTVNRHCRPARRRRRQATAGRCPPEGSFPTKYSPWLDPDADGGAGRAGDPPAGGQTGCFGKSHGLRV